MKLQSFRFRITLFSAVLASIALMGFSIVSWWLIYDAKVKRLDAEIKNQLIQSTRPQSTQWETYTDSLPSVLGMNGATTVALLVNDRDGNLLYRSRQWQDGLDANSLWRSLPQPPPDPDRIPFELEPPPPPHPPYPLSPIAPLDPPHPDRPNSFSPRERRPPRDRHPQPDRPNSFSPRERRPPRDRPDFPQVFQAKLATRRSRKAVWRVGAIHSPQTQVAIAVNLQAIDLEMASIGNIFLISIPVVLVLVAGGAWVISRSILYPIGRLTTAIRNVTVQGLDHRVPIGSTDIEFLELIFVFNQMLERLERSFQQASRFSGDAAHELKTPLAILQGQLERALHQSEPGSEIQQTVSNLLDEVRRLTEITRKLLLLSLADAGRMSLNWVEVNMSALLAEIAEDMELLAPDLEVQMAISPNLFIKGDRDLLVQVLQNLVGNAIKYNLPQGWLKLQAKCQGKRVIVKIVNSSQDISLSEGDRIFDRFHRGDSTQTQKIEGSGLGLSLAREIARAHGGDIKLDAAILGQTGFILSLPVGDRD
ncbi:MAG: ATP-binding protein [Tychonema bourrellyi B0820]|uniref:histidine kinase n=1 Tax=Tychonema bourrellyi FEM_GT703 TaxID=2040638 RepID=A0A2G4F4R9_9CYAN|nr:ATP-binding protein [Tychonema bourrellyi]MDQ2097648.1 ATP-binding protein [Tychonema bourrellyi B0820]PHX56725.1 two-component sensor histidine kinase [Tychonema bourrellyi FEM_GT703]